MSRPLRHAAAAAALLPPLLLAPAAPALAHDGDHGGECSRGHGGHQHGDHDGLPATYLLTGDPEGSLFEGIAVTRDRETFYVSEITGGEIHRGDVDERRTEVWLDADDAADHRRRAAVGLATDHRGRVYVAGGDNATQPDAAAGDPDFWVYDADGDLLASLRVPSDDPVFLNDVVVGPDGAAYVTDSMAPQIFRVAREDGDWQAAVWAAPDPDRGPQQEGDFGLNGIEVAPDCHSLIVAQSDVGELWNYDLETAVPTRIDTGDVDLTSTDGLVVRGRTLVAVRNFPQLLTYLRLDEDATSARLLAEVPTDPDRVFTTGDVAEGRLLLVDSQFDEEPPSPDSEVVARPFRP
jgi:sugar lactone lactonase YvrE